MRIFIEAVAPDPIDAPPAVALWPGVLSVKDRTAEFNDVPAGSRVYEVNCTLPAYLRAKGTFKERTK